MDQNYFNNNDPAIRYFNYKAYLFKWYNGHTHYIQEIELEACTAEHWNEFPNIKSKFDALQAWAWKCPKLGQKIQLLGSASTL